MKTFIDIFDRHFAEVHDSSCAIIKGVPPEKLFWKPDHDFATLSCGGYILRSAGKVEQTFGGITTRLWDDPFEWTLPEELSSKEKVLDYLGEVEATRQRGFGYFDSDEDLKKELPAPEKFITIFDLLLDTLVIARSTQNDARSVLNSFS